MTQEKPTSDFIDIAWKTALAANKIFEKLQKVRRTTEQLREVGRLGLEGIVIEDRVYGTLEDEYTRMQGEFETLINMAAPAMLMQNSPFSIQSQEVSSTSLSNEEREDQGWWQSPQKIVLSGDGLERISREDYDQFMREISRRGIQMTIIRREALSSEDENPIFDFDSTVRDLEEMEAFARMHKYDKSMYTNVYNTLLRKAQKLKVNSYEEYETATSDTPPAELTLVVLPNKDVKIDIRTLYNAVKEWQKARKADIPNFGVTRISFFADYLNRAILDIEEPLIVTHPPQQLQRKKEQIQARQLRELPPHKLLLDAIDNEERKKIS